MIGITNIGIHIAPETVNTVEQADAFGVSRSFIEEKIGITAVSRKKGAMRASALCVAAYQDLVSGGSEAAVEGIDFVCVCTQNGDYRLPQTSAIVQHKLGLPSTCAAFDIALGCSGYVYALHVVMSFMESCGLHKGLLFTADPYSEIIDPKDKNTALIFGDGASVTLMTEDPVLSIGKGAFATHGDMHDSLIKRENKSLSMNGRSIFNFSMLHVPPVVNDCLTANGIKRENVDLFLFHQASRYVVDNLCQRIGLDPQKTPFVVKNYGNTVSSSIPIALKNYLKDSAFRTVLICGFGVGLSIASSLLRRT